MTVKELMEHLSKFDGDTEVMILDGFNGQGNKRTINFIPDETETILKEDSETSGDCEYKVGSGVVLIGFGCY